VLKRVETPVNGLGSKLRGEYRAFCVCVLQCFQCIAVCCSVLHFVVDPLNVFCSKLCGENHVFVLCVAVRCSV